MDRITGETLKTLTEKSPDSAVSIYMRENIMYWP